VKSLSCGALTQHPTGSPQDGALVLTQPSCCLLQVLQLVELEPIRGSIVGKPGESGLSVEQRKRLTIAVELVANPSIVFMDEPTSGARPCSCILAAPNNAMTWCRVLQMIDVQSHLRTLSNQSRTYTGLDARAAAIVMRTVRNTVNTGRTVVCTIHQPSIDIFEAFDDLLLMKAGGMITCAAFPVSYALSIAHSS